MNNNNLYNNLYISPLDKNINLCSILKNSYYFPQASITGFKRAFVTSLYNKGYDTSIRTHNTCNCNTIRHLVEKIAKVKNTRNWLIIGGIIYYQYKKHN